jgi:hypothetical protein
MKDELSGPSASSWIDSAKCTKNQEIIEIANRRFGLFRGDVEEGEVFNADCLVNELLALK